MKRLLIVPIALMLLLGAGQPAQAAQHKPSRSSTAVACTQVGYTIKGTTDFAAQPSWQSLKFVQRLDGVSTTISVGWKAVHDPVTLYGVDSTETEALNPPTNYLSVTADHSGVAIYAC